ncbi:MAG: aminoacyl-tRNA hydrolase [Myxococcales bacterium]|nr:aminoacyl-tRNA hydrolase [Myxococcales bacterium]
MLLVVGLGNPGKQYEGHRHNVGFMVVDALAELVEAPPFRQKFSAEMAKVELRREEGLLLKPQTYMNLSGDSVQPCAAYFKLPPGQVVVIHDELDVPFGEIRLKMGGGHAGHNGLRSIIGRMGPDFARIRVGIGRPPASFRGDVADYVLSDFSALERADLPKIVEKAAKTVLSIATRGFQAAMKTTNTRPKKKPEAKKAPEDEQALTESPESPDPS